MVFPLSRLVPVLVALAAIAGTFLYGVSVGKKGQKIIYQERIIKASENHADIERRQNEIITNRANYDIIERLQSGSF